MHSSESFWLSELCGPSKPIVPFSVLKVQVSRKFFFLTAKFLKLTKIFGRRKLGKREKLLVKGLSFVTCFGESLWELFGFNNAKVRLNFSLEY